MSANSLGLHAGRKYVSWQRSKKNWFWLLGASVEVMKVMEEVNLAALQVF